MGLILSIYAKDIFEEVLLPAVDNTNFSLRLSSERYNLQEDLQIKFEVIDNQWRIFENTDFELKFRDENYFGKNLKDGDILRICLQDNRIITMTVIAADEGLAPFTKYSLKNINQITIGKLKDNTIVVDNIDLVSGHHAKLFKDKDEWKLEDISTNGSYVGYKRIHGLYSLKFGDCINIFGYKIIFLEDFLAINCKNDENVQLTKVETISNEIINYTNLKKAKKYFRRSPRHFPDLCKDKLVIESAPALHVSEKRPLLLVIGPAFTMTIPMMLGSMIAILGSNMSSGTYMYTGIITASASAVIGTSWALINLKYNKKREEEEKKKRFESYSNYLIEITDYLKQKQSENSNILHDVYPSAQICSSYSENDFRLWNRNSNHDDFLFIRLGIGDMPFQMQIETQTQHFSMSNDPMMGKPEILKKEYKYLRQVPIGISLLEHRMIGVISQDLKKSFDMARLLAVQIAANHCYTEVKMAFIGNYTDYNGIGWDFARWFPHTWSENRRIRYFANLPQENREILYHLSRIFRNRVEEQNNKKQNPLPHYVIFLDNMSVLENEPAAKYILNPKSEYGLTTILLSQNYENLPNSCEYIIQNNNEFCGVYSVTDTLEKRQKIAFDNITISETDAFARRLSSIQVNELENGTDIPSMLDFFDMMEINTLDDLDISNRWKKNRTYDSMRALIGRKAGDVNCYLDIHEKYHGPHGLLAGTTGSGKSETLQTYILSLAVNYSPLDVAFLLIDFKGGGMANLFANLPHTVGMISNLSGSQIRRAMVSIKSENLRRQKIFGEYGVNHIDAYTKLFKNQEATEPIPHLLIVIDEFAELKREEPEFMRELISVAQVGRSLGVHLILATQKPAGTVDDNIRSNTKFRICLRVQDRQDSTDMLHKPDAAYITQAGRGYLQVGSDEVYELFQSGWSGAKYDEDRRKNNSSSVTMLDLTGRAAMIGSRSEMLRKQKRKYEWVKSITDVILKTVNDADKISKTEHSNEFINMITRALITSLPNYLDSKRNTIQLEKMLSMWPENQENIVDELIKRMDNKGEKFPEWKEKTQLDAVVEYLEQIAIKEHCENHLKLWLPPLAEQMPLSNLMRIQTEKVEWSVNESEWTLDAPIGLCDAPENQMQTILSIDFANNGHYAICGMVDSGKSTFLQTLIFSMVNRYNPEHLNIYGLDFSAGKLNIFKDLAHVGGIIDGKDLGYIQKFFKMIERILSERQKKLAGGDFKQYIRNHKGEMPAIIIVIDQYSAFREKTEDKYSDIILKLSTVGSSCGIYLAVTAGGFGSAEIPNRLAENFRTAISLEMSDKFKYGDIMRTMHFSTLPESGIKGRGLVNVGGSILEFQTAIALVADDDYKRSEQLEAWCKNANKYWNGRRAEQVPTIPEKPMWNEFCQLESFRNIIKDKTNLPIGYVEEDASIYSIDLTKNFCYLVGARKRTGCTNTIKLIMESAAKKDGKLVVIDNKNCELRKLTEALNGKYICDRKSNFEFWKELLPEFAKRNKEKRVFVEKGCEDEEIFNNMLSYEKIYIVIHDLASFIDQIYLPADPAANIGEMYGFIQNVMEKGKLHQVYIFAGFDVTKYSEYISRDAFKSFLSYKTGLLLGGDIDKQRIFTFDNLSYNERSKPSNLGVGFASSTQKLNQAEKVILPQWKGQ